MHSDNIMLLCRAHHGESHTIGWKRFSEKFPQIIEELANKGWTFENFQGVWKLTRTKEWT